MFCRRCGWPVVLWREGEEVTLIHAVGGVNDHEAETESEARAFEERQADWDDERRGWIGL